MEQVGCWCVGEGDIVEGDSLVEESGIRDKGVGGLPMWVGQCVLLQVGGAEREGGWD